MGKFTARKIQKYKIERKHLYNQFKPKRFGNHYVVWKERSFESYVIMPAYVC